MGRTSDAKDRLLQAISDLMWEANFSCLTIDVICERAQVRKGSFYYFFKSKAELATEAIRVRWEAKKAEMDKHFSPTRPPLERLKVYFDHVQEHQAQGVADHGRVLGCPDFNFGTEISSTAPELAHKVQRILTELRQYFESAIRDAQAAGNIDVDDVAETARCVLGFYEGTLTQARIHNDPALLNDIWPGTLRILGVKPDRSDMAA